MQNEKGYSTAFPDKDKFLLLDSSWCLRTRRVTSRDSSPQWRTFSQAIYIQSIEPKLYFQQVILRAKWKTF